VEYPTLPYSSDPGEWLPCKTRNSVTAGLIYLCSGFLLKLRILKLNRMWFILMDCRKVKIRNAELTEMCTKCQLLSLVIMSNTSLALELLMP
jgi:hypothetical protein